jgi:phosphoglycerate dehydrogenase-like enzyme
MNDSFRVLVTARSFANTPGAHHDYLQQHNCAVELRAGAHPLSAAELRDLIGGYDGAILGLDVCNASVIAHADKLRTIARYGVGVDQVDLAAASERGIIVTNTPGTNRIGVAELCIGLIFALARNIPAVAAASSTGRWRREAGWELSGKTLGLIGLGMVGREVAARAAALGMIVLAFDPLSSGDLPGVRRTDLGTLLAESHVVSLHCALTPDTEGMMNADRLGHMREGAYLINTARGALVDETALLDALTNGKLAGAAADALRDDPPLNNPLLALDNFLYMPHLGATTRESVERTAMLTVQNLVAVLHGEPCQYIVNIDQLKLKGAL